MKTTIRILNTALLALATVGFVGCASVRTKPSGFLGSYEDMKPSKPGGRGLVYRDAAINGEYHAVIVEPVSLQTNAAAKLSPRKQVELAEKLTGRARKVFAGKYEIATEPGPGVLRLRMTVNDINKSSPVINVVTTAAAYLPFDMGAVSVEMEAVDSVNGHRVAALLGKRQGLPLTPAGFFGSFVPTGHARTGFTRLAKAMLEVVSDPGNAPIAQSVQTAQTAPRN
jgi:hypothetical protein